MKRLPQVVASSVLRATQMGDSHGGIYFVDLESGAFEKKVDWHETGIDWQGRGGERGLRGIAFHNDLLYCAANDRIIVMDQMFRTIKILKNRYLSQCHELFVYENKLIVTSTRHDHIIMYDLETRIWSKGVHLCPIPWINNSRNSNPMCRAKSFNAGGKFGPRHWRRKQRYHINMAFMDNKDLCFSGVFLPNILTVRNDYVKSYATIPMGTHNAQPYKDMLVYNHTEENCACLATHDGNVIRKFPVPIYDPCEFDSKITDNVARQGFARGLCFVEDEIIIVGSSPATITIYDINSGNIIKSINLSMDIRNAIHGLEIWPF